MYRYLLRLVVLAASAPLLLSACKDNADPVKPKVTTPSVSQPAA